MVFFLGYCIYFADSAFPKTQVIGDNLEINNQIVQVEKMSLLSVLVRRFGHACVKINPDAALITGGFGVDIDHKHKKLSGAFIFRNSNASLQFIKTDIKRMFHTMVLLNDQTVFLFGGRLSPKKPCCSYGFYKVENDNLEPIHIFNDCSCASENGNPKCRWRHSAVYLKGINLYMCVDK